MRRTVRLGLLADIGEWNAFRLERILELRVRLNHMTLKYVSHDFPIPFLIFPSLYLSSQSRSSSNLPSNSTHHLAFPLVNPTEFPIPAFSHTP